MENLEKIENREPEPIADIETNKAILEQWKKEGLNNEIISLLNNDFEEMVSKNGKFILSADNFPSTKEFIQAAEKSFTQFDAKNLYDKLDEVKNNLRKVILTFTFEDLQINPEKPVIIREEREKKGDEEITRKYFATNRPGIVLVSDESNWWLERKNGI